MQYNTIMPKQISVYHDPLIQAEQTIQKYITDQRIEQKMLFLKM